MDKEISRRSLLLSIACLLLWGYTGKQFYNDEQYSSDFLAQKLSNVFPQKPSAKKIGKEYLLVAPAEANKEVLLNKICSFKPNWKADLISSDRSVLLKMLRHQKDCEFETGATVKVDGWILSRLEGRLCALSTFV